MKVKMIIYTSKLVTGGTEIVFTWVTGTLCQWVTRKFFPWVTLVFSPGIYVVFHPLESMGYYSLGSLWHFSYWSQDHSSLGSLGDFPPGSPEYITKKLYLNSNRHWTSDATSWINPKQQKNAGVYTAEM